MWYETEPNIYESLACICLGPKISSWIPVRYAEFKFILIGHYLILVANHLLLSNFV